MTNYYLNQPLWFTGDFFDENYFYSERFIVSGNRYVWKCTKNSYDLSNELFGYGEPDYKENT